mgnify:CR=1 FL=1
MTDPTTSTPKADLSAQTALRIAQRIADEIGCKAGQVNSAVQMLDEGSTVPFIARYRKEATGGLDDTQLRKLEERLIYLREMEDRRVGVVVVLLDEHERRRPREPTPRRARASSRARQRRRR